MYFVRSMERAVMSRCSTTVWSRIVGTRLPRTQSPVHGGLCAADHHAQRCQVIPTEHVLNVTNKKCYQLGSLKVFNYIYNIL